MFKKIYFTAVVLFILANIFVQFVAPYAMAAGPSTSGLPGEDLSVQDLFAIINGLACWLIRIAFSLMVIFLVVVGLQFMNARANPTKRAEAIKNFQRVLTGIVVIMGAYVIIATVANAVGSTDFSYIPLKC
jgi:hypothetical protein